MRILLVEDHKTVSESLKVLLENNEYEVTTASNAMFALKLLPLNEYDLIITDIEMPELNGIDFIKKLRLMNNRDYRILVLTTHASSSMIEQLIKLNVNGYLNKASSSLDLFQAIRYILDGKEYYPGWTKKYAQKRQHENTAVYFTKREIDVLRLILSENTTREIAEELGLAVSTIEEHRRNLLIKTNSKNVVGLVKYCIVNQIL